MVSTSISSSIVVRFTDREDNTSLEVSAYEASALSGHIEPTTIGILDENHYYTIELFTDFLVASDSIEISVNDGDFIRGKLRQLSMSGDIGNETCVYEVYDLARRTNVPNHRSLFEQTYGLARIEFRIPGVGSFITMDVPCACSLSVKPHDVRSMLETLLDSGDSSVADWVFAQDAGDSERYAILDAGTGEDSTLSIASFLDLVQRIIGTYESCYSFFRSGAHCVVTGTSKRIPGLQVRHLGAKEFSWLMKNAEVFSAVGADIGVKYRGKSYFPHHIMSQVKSKSFDCYENETVLSFLSEMADALRNAELKLTDALRSIQGYVTRLNVVKGNRELPALIVMEECARREERLVDKMREMRSKALSLRSVYRDVLPDVQEVKLPSTSLHKSKVFQEVNAYSRIYDCILDWREFSDFTLARESLALHVLRLDKLYEYYALFRLLDTLKQYGYDVDENADGTPIARVEYDLNAPLYENERTVNTLYCLATPRTRIKLYYQPVIFGSEREQHGITFHRKSPRSTFAQTVEDSYYTPDFMIVADTGDSSKAYVLDAKYSNVDALTHQARRGVESRYDEAYGKYIDDIANASRNSPDAMWLLAGKENDPAIRPSYASSWLSNQEGFVESGIAPLSPSADGLLELFELLGIIGPRQTDTGAFSSEGSVEFGLSDQGYSLSNSEIVDLTEGVSHGENAIREEIMSLAPLALTIRLIELHVNQQDLYEQKWAMKELGQNRPVLRHTMPQGRREKSFYVSQNLSIGTVYVLNHWRKNQLLKLRKLVIKHEEANYS